MLTQQHSFAGHSQHADSPAATQVERDPSVGDSEPIRAQHIKGCRIHNTIKPLINGQLASDDANSLTAKSILSRPTTPSPMLLRSNRLRHPRQCEHMSVGRARIRRRALRCTAQVPCLRGRNSPHTTRKFGRRDREEVSGRCVAGRIHSKASLRKAELALVSRYQAAQLGHEVCGLVPELTTALGMAAHCRTPGRNVHIYPILGRQLLQEGFHERSVPIINF